MREHCGGLLPALRPGYPIPMSSDDPIERLAKRVAGSTPPAPVKRRQTTIKLKEPTFSAVSRYCHSKGVAFSDVVDSLLEVFYQKLLTDGEITLDHDPPNSKKRPS